MNPTMNTRNLKAEATVAAIAPALLSAAQAAVGSGAVDELIANVKNADDKVRGPAWQSAGQYGAPAVKPLADVMRDPDFEIARAAKRALWKIVRHAGRPGAAKEARAVSAQLIPLLTTGSAPVKREALWMLSEIAGDEAVAPMAALLSDTEVRDDARCALTRMPGGKATAALKKAMGSAPEDFKYALADSLRSRGEKVSGYPSRKLVPTKQTSVKAVAGS